MKPLLIGEAPSESSDPARPLGYSSGVLLQMMGYRSIGAEGEDPYGMLKSLFEPVNLLDEVPPKVGKGYAWDEEAAQEMASIFRGRREGRKVVMLGKRVASAFGFGVDPRWPVDWWEWRIRRGPAKEEDVGSYVAVPHPSAINRIYNEPRNRVSTGAVLWQAAGGIALPWEKPDWAGAETS